MTERGITGLLAGNCRTALQCLPDAGKTQMQKNLTAGWHDEPKGQHATCGNAAPTEDRPDTGRLVQTCWRHLTLQRLQQSLCHSLPVTVAGVKHQEAWLRGWQGPNQSTQCLDNPPLGSCKQPTHSSPSPTCTDYQQPWSLVDYVQSVTCSLAMYNQ